MVDNNNKSEELKLKEKENELRRKLLDMRFDLKLGRLSNTASIRETKKELARVLTSMRQNNG